MIWQDSKSAKRKEFYRTLKLIATCDSGETVKAVEKREGSSLLKGQDQERSD